MDLGLNKNATRMLTGFILGLIVVSAIILGGIWLALMILAFICMASREYVKILEAFICMASREYVKILEHKGFYPSLKIIIASEIFLAIIAYLKQFDLVSLALTLCTMAAFLWVLFRGRQPYIANVATTILGFVYCGWFPLHLIFLRDLHSCAYSSGLGFVIMMFTSILLTDIGCYYVGTKFGKHKLAPIVSPNKTIEGSIGGVICAMIGASLVGLAIGVEWYLSALAGLLCTVCAQVGDLCESLIKRDAGVKDSGNSLPGHGGFLDRADSFIFTIPAMFYFTKWVIMNDSAMPAIIQFFKNLS